MPTYQIASEGDAEESVGRGPAFLRQSTVNIPYSCHAALQHTLPIPSLPKQQHFIKTVGRPFLFLITATTFLRTAINKTHLLQFVQDRVEEGQAPRQKHKGDDPYGPYVDLAAVLLLFYYFRSQVEIAATNAVGPRQSSREILAWGVV